MYSLWPVGDRQTAALMRAFYSVLLDGGTYAGGLRAAKLKLLSNSSTAFPSKWAGFVLVGR
jgi:CHAT domain-containing protein